jgi:DNA-binding response OmpR family regulator
MSKILVVEDEPIIAQLIEDFLNDEGYQVSHAHSGEEAIAVMALKPPDLVLLDLRLPAMDGMEVCREMRRDARLMGVPVIVLTANTSASEQKLAWQAGADDYVIKPFDLDELAQHIHAQLHYCEHQRVSEMTGLPTGSAVVEAIRRCVNHPAQRLAVIYVNIEHLDEYNQTYSYLEGNELIQKTAVILREALAKGGGRDDFLGDDGGGEFVIITAPEHAAATISEATSRFNHDVPQECFPAATYRQDYVTTNNHDRQLSPCPLAELSFDTLDNQAAA